MDEIEEIPDVSTTPPAGHRVLPCPVCRAPMGVQSRGGTTIDVCPEHGVWLDSGELDRVVTGLTGRLRVRGARRAEQARRAGRVQGALFGWWSLLGD